MPTRSLQSSKKERRIPPGIVVVRTCRPEPSLSRYPYPHPSEQPSFEEQQEKLKKVQNSIPSFSFGAGPSPVGTTPSTPSFGFGGKSSGTGSNTSLPTSAFGAQASSPVNTSSTIPSFSFLTGAANATPPLAKPFETNIGPTSVPAATQGGMVSQDASAPAPSPFNIAPVVTSTTLPSFATPTVSDASSGYKMVLPTFGAPSGTASSTFALASKKSDSTNQDTPAPPQIGQAVGGNATAINVKPPNQDTTASSPITSASDANTGIGKEKGPQSIRALHPKNPEEVAQIVKKLRGLNSSVVNGNVVENDPLEMVQSPHENLTTLTTLFLSAGANSRNSEVRFIEAVKAGDFEAVKHFLEEFTACMDLPIVIASGNGHTDIVKLLLKAGANVNAFEGKALQSAVASGHIDTVKTLLAAGGTANWQGCLFDAIHHGHLHVAATLLNWSPDQSEEADTPKSSSSPPLATLEIISDWAAPLAAKQHRVETIYVMGELSQGFVIPLETLPDHRKLILGTDVTRALGISKYVRPPTAASLKRAYDDMIAGGGETLKEFMQASIRRHDEAQKLCKPNGFKHIIPIPDGVFKQIEIPYHLSEKEQRQAIKEGLERKEYLMLGGDATSRRRDILSYSDGSLRNPVHGGYGVNYPFQPECNKSGKTEPSSLAAEIKGIVTAMTNEDVEPGHNNFQIGADCEGAIIDVWQAVEKGIKPEKMTQEDFDLVRKYIQEHPETVSYLRWNKAHQKGEMECKSHTVADRMANAEAGPSNAKRIKTAKWTKTSKLSPAVPSNSSGDSDTMDAINMNPTRTHPMCRSRAEATYGVASPTCTQSPAPGAPPPRTTPRTALPSIICPSLAASTNPALEECAYDELAYDDPNTYAVRITADETSPRQSCVRNKPKKRDAGRNLRLRQQRKKGEGEREEEGGGDGDAYEC
ncbi:hypothetical protein HDV00_012423 [Rhizophlyctis rosea]|nr:hypothetical protein HDV00_012423 [Rhizophlyctis rosea]